MAQQQLAARAHGSATQKPNVSAMVQSGLGQAGAIIPIGHADAGESSNQILGKRSIRELVNQIDPFEKLDPSVEDVLIEIADDFVGSITKFACSLAKHRKSKTVEAKDILLHAERNWNLTLPGFGGDEIKFFKKQSTNDIHKERLAAIKKSMTSDAAHGKNPPSGQTPGSAKTYAGKAPMTAGQSERA